MSFSFPKSKRLRKRAAYLRVQRSGKSHHSRYFVFVHKMMKNERACNGGGQLGITVSKKVGNAIVRNRIKRVVREFVRTALPSINDEVAIPWLPSSMNLVVIAKKSAYRTKTQLLWEDLESIRGTLLWEHSQCT